MPADRACHLYVYAIREHADEAQQAEIDAALEPPITAKVGGTPQWYGSDEDVWTEWQVAMKIDR